MSNPWVRLVLLGFLLCLAIAPFAGLAPIMILLLVLGIGWMLGMVQQIILGRPLEKHTQGSDQHVGHY